MSCLAPTRDYTNQSTYLIPQQIEPSAPPYSPPGSYLPIDEVEEDISKDFVTVDWKDSQLAEPFEEIEACHLANYSPNFPKPSCPDLPHYTPINYSNYSRLADDEPSLLQRNIAAIIKVCDEYRNSLFKFMMYYAVEGFDSHKVFPFYVAIWKPNPIKSTKNRRDRYLKMFNGNQNAATQHLLDKSNPIKKRVMVSGVTYIPYFGEATGYFLNTWHQLRQVTLIAAIHGHDIHKDDVQEKIYNCLLGGNFFKAVGLSTDKIIYKVAEDWFKKFGIKEAVSQIIPLNVIFNFLSNDAAKVSGHAKLVFGGEQSIPVTDWNN